MNQIPWENIQNKLRHPDEPEDETLSQWLNASQENKTLWNELKVIYSITGNVPDSFVAQKDEAWQNVMGRISVKQRHPSVFRIMFRVAASILLIALGAAGSLLVKTHPETGSFTEVYSPSGHKTQVLLPDGSLVWLNGDSRIKYNTNFTDSRSVELIGEALFEVVKNPKKLFSVKAANLRLEVYGTTFNVRSYPNDQISEVALVEGSVGVFQRKQLLKKMMPGEVISYNSSENKFSSYRANLEQITSWKTDELVINNESFENVTKYLERWYGVKISMDKSIQLNTRLSFKVKTESFAELLSIINRITPITYEINGKQVKISRPINFKN